jgi:hypothetical protein
MVGIEGVEVVGSGDADADGAPVVAVASTGRPDD